MSAGRSQLLLMILLIGMFAVDTALYIRMQTLEETMILPPIVVRIDDIQDFAFRDAQLFLLQYNMVNNIPMSLAVIPKVFGLDKELVETVSSAVQRGSEVTVHGWEHEDLAKLSLDEQKERLLKAKQLLRKILDVNISTLAPPMFSYNDDTLSAMRQAGYDVISGYVCFQRPGPVSERVVSIPATIEMSNFANGMWQMKGVENLSKEVMMSIEIYGYAVVLTHPQEFMKNGILSQDALAVYTTLIKRLQGSYFFTVIEKLRYEVMSP